MSHRLELVDFLLIAEAVLDRPAKQVAYVVSVPAVESALAAPFASFGGIDFYEDPAERAAICCSRIIRNHPLPDGNKRLGYECMREMLEREGIPWPRPSEDVDEIASTIEGLAARTISERDFVDWVERRTEIRE
jgi:death-on-curing protein